MKKFLGKLTRETLVLALAVGVGVVAFIFGKLGVAAMIGLTFYYTAKKGAIDRMLDNIMNSIPGGAGIPPVPPEDDEDESGKSIPAGAGTPPPPPNP